MASVPLFEFVWVILKIFQQQITVHILGKKRVDFFPNSFRSSRQLLPGCMQRKSCGLLGKLHNHSNVGVVCCRNDISDSDFDRKWSEKRHRLAWTELSINLDLPDYFFHRKSSALPVARLTNLFSEHALIQLSTQLTVQAIRQPKATQEKIWGKCFRWIFF